MRKHIVADEQFRPAMAFGDFPRRFFVEEGGQRRDGIQPRDVVALASYIQQDLRAGR